MTSEEPQAAINRAGLMFGRRGGVELPLVLQWRRELGVNRPAPATPPKAPARLVEKVFFRHDTLSQFRA